MGSAIADDKKFTIEPPDSGFEVEAPPPTSPTGPRDAKTLNVPGGEGFPGMPNVTPNIIPEEEAARRLRGTVTMRGDPTTMTDKRGNQTDTPAVAQEKRLLDYNPGGQLMTAAMTAPSSVGLVRAGIANPVAAGKMLVGAGAGSAAGGYGGREIGGLFGAKGREYGGEVGSLLGGLAGGFAGAKGMRIPSRGFLGEMLWGEKPPVDPVRLAVREGRAAMIPTRMKVAKLEAPEPELGSPENPGWHSKLPDRMPTPEAPVDPLALAVREGRAARLPVRMTPFRSEPELGSPENPGWMTKLSDRIPVKSTRMESPEGSPLAVRPKNALRAAARPEGRPATWTNDRVKELAAWGDPAAIEQARLRGFGRIPLKYEVAPITPKEKFTFSAEGEPKRVE